MTEEKKKRRTAMLILPAVAIILFLLIPVLHTLFSTGDYIITYTDERSFRGRKPLILGNCIICIMEDEQISGKSKVSASEDNSYSLSFISLQEVKLIERASNDGEPEIAPQTVDPRYLGTYKIRLQGYTGQLRLRQDKDHVKGTVRFPDWANGKTEYLKNIRITGGKIYFTRSANSDSEIRRLGAGSYFNQRFSGTYSSNGQNISGFFINHRKEKHQWDAER